MGKAEISVKDQIEDVSIELFETNSSAATFGGNRLKSLLAAQQAYYETTISELKAKIDAHVKKFNEREAKFNDDASKHDSAPRYTAVAFAGVDGDPGGLNGEWLPLLRTQNDRDVEVTPDDLDSIVANYADPSAPKAPIFFGPANQQSQSYGTVDAVKRVGTTLHGRFSRVDPRIEQLHRDGSLKRTVQIERGVNGYSLKNVSFLRPGYGAHAVYTDHLPGSLDDALKQHFAPQNVRFAIEKSQRLSDLAYKRARAMNISFGESLSAVAREHPELI